MKYHNIPKFQDGHWFHSQKEAARYRELNALERGKLIRDLELQPRFALDVNGIHICNYFADFKYFDNDRKVDVVEDTKGFRTETYKIKKRLMLAIHGIEVEEI